MRKRKAKSKSGMTPEKNSSPYMRQKESLDASFVDRVIFFLLLIAISVEILATMIWVLLKKRCSSVYRAIKGLKKTKRKLFDVSHPFEGPTYKLATNGTDDCITCLVCGMTSWNPNDVKYKYCGNCHQFHDIMEAMTLL
jgi:hypothetical protein